MAPGAFSLFAPFLRRKTKKWVSRKCVFLFSQIFDPKVWKAWDGRPGKKTTRGRCWRTCPDQSQNCKNSITFLHRSCFCCELFKAYSLSPFWSFRWHDVSGQAGQFDHKRGLRTANQRWGWGDYFYIYIATPPYNSFGKWKWSIWMYFPGIVSDLLNSGSFHAQLAGSPLYHSLSVIRGDWILSFLELQRQCVFTVHPFMLSDESPFSHSACVSKVELTLLNDFHRISIFLFAAPTPHQHPKPFFSSNSTGCYIDFLKNLMRTINGDSVCHPNLAWPLNYIAWRC